MMRGRPMEDEPIMMHPAVQPWVNTDMALANLAWAIQDHEPEVSLWKCMKDVSEFHQAEKASFIDFAQNRTKDSQRLDFLIARGVVTRESIDQAMERDHNN